MENNNDLKEIKDKLTSLETYIRRIDSVVFSKSNVSNLVFNLGINLYTVLTQVNVINENLIKLAKKLKVNIEEPESAEKSE